jgi:uncharacterized membrane protein
MPYKRITLAIIFIWFFVGGIAHFAVPEFFLKIVPPNLLFRLEAVYVSGFFEIVGALGLLHQWSRRIAGIGLFILTIAVTPANIYMWQNAHVFSNIPEPLLMLRLALQVVLLACIWWAAISTPDTGTSAPLQ